MTIDVSRVALGKILPFRERYRQEMNCQIVHNSLHERGLTDSYLIRADRRPAGHGCVAGLPAEARDVINEFYVLPAHRAAALALFRQFAAVSQAKIIEAQTNDSLLTLMLFDCARSIEREKILFHDAFTTNLEMPGSTFRRVSEGDRDRIFPHQVEPVGEWMIEAGGEVVATGGIMLHYNVPYGDLYMEVAETFRRRGYGSYLVQELKRTCYEMGRIPAARCQASNETSRATLQRAGLLPCAHVLRGVIVA